MEKVKCINLDYLMLRTKSNPILMMEMISLYLEQTPPLISTMKQSLQDKDWNSLYASVHKMIPSFSIIGVSKNVENIAKKVQEYARLNGDSLNGLSGQDVAQVITQEQTDKISDLVLQLENVCEQACKELKEEFNTIKKTTTN